MLQVLQFASSGRYGEALLPDKDDQEHKMYVSHKKQAPVGYLL